jgi:acyl dehydratase
MAEALTRRFTSAPATLPLYAKAVLSGLPVLGLLPGLRHVGSSAPGLVMARDDVRTDIGHLTDYATVCGLRVADTLPATYPHLAAFGLQLALMTEPTFPFAAMGTVHVANAITQHRPLHVGEAFDVRVHAEDLRPHPKGRLIDLVSAASVDGEVVWEETMTLLSRGGGDASARDSLPLRDTEPPTGPTRWRVPADTGRRYAGVSGDRNPIHLYGVTAKAFGFPRPIAHGMWTKARCLAALQGRLTDSFTVQVAFRKPVLMPTTVVFGWKERADDVSAFGVSSARDGSPHLVGAVTPH